MLFPIRSSFTGKVLHTIDVGDRRIEPYAPDLRGLNFTNADLRGAELQFANLEDAILLGADLREANLQHANLRNADMRYCNLAGCTDLREADLRGAELYPSNVSIKTRFYGSKMDAGGEFDILRIEIAHAVRRKLLGNGIEMRRSRTCNFKNRMQAAKDRSNFLYDEMEDQEEWSA